MPPEAVSFTGHFCSLLPILRTLSINWSQGFLETKKAHLEADQVDEIVRQPSTPQ
jgi:hypothetical protein